MDNLRIEQTPHQLRIHYRWYKLQYLFLLFFFIAWDAFLVFWYAIGLADGIWIMLLFPIVHVAVGIGGTYYVLAGFLNTTTVEVTPSRLLLRHHPLPWLGGNKAIDLHQVTQFYVKEKITKGKNGTQRNYQLRYLDEAKNDKKVFPFGMSMEVEEVQQMERLIEDFLGIRDFYVEGEYANKSIQTTTSQQPFRFPQHKQANHDPLTRTIFDLRLGSMVDYDGQSWEAREQWQYDAENQDVYQAFRLVSGTDEQLLFFKTGSRDLLLKEEKILSFQVRTRTPLYQLPEEAEVGGVAFRKAFTTLTTKFDKRKNTPLFEAKLVFYHAEDESQLLRLEMHGNSINAVYLGRLVDADAFTQVLPPGDS